MSARPTGTVTFLFTDIEGSTAHWENHPDAMQRAFARHEQIIREAVARRSGYAYKMIGDAFQIAFANAPDAMAAAIDAQRALHGENWDGIGELQVRMALHSGITEERGDDYVGPELNRVARMINAGYGGQILISEAAYHLLSDQLPDRHALRDLGEHRLRDLIRPERIYQLIAPDLPADFPALRTLDARPNNLPVLLTSFVGREREMAQVKELLASTRLLTLLGVGGTGKTRLSLEVAADLLDANTFRDGIWLIELAALSDAALVPQAIATALSVHEKHSELILDTLVAHLSDKNLLLILDNCEHLIDACARTAEAILRACPRIKILATSREALSISGEQVWRVPSLALPNLDQSPPLETLAQFEAVRLFLDRARLTLPSFSLTDANAVLIAQICSRLDGIPLAIELAAARVKSLSVEQIAVRLDDRFRLLTGGSRTALPRQQTLQSLVDWSYDLLSEPERAAFQRLAVFANGWTLEAAEAVLGQADTPNVSYNVLDLLTRLMDKSLVVIEECDGRPRYRMLDTIRQYARGKLVESGEAERVRTRHAEYFLNLAEEAEPELRGAEQLFWMNRLEAEHDNLRMALDWWLCCNSFAALRLAGALFWFWRLRDYWKEGCAWLEQALAQGDAETGIERKKVRAKALNAAMWMAYDQGDRPVSHKHHDACLVLFQELNDTRGLADLELFQGILSWHRGDHADARAHLKRSCTLSEQANFALGVADAIHILGHVDSDLNDYQDAREHFEASLGRYRQLGDILSISTLLSDVGLIYYLEGDLLAAERHMQESLDDFREHKSRDGIAATLNRLGDIARVRGDYAQAAAWYEESLAIFRELGEKLGVASGLHNLAQVALNAAEFERARTLLKESLELNHVMGNKAGIAECLAAYGEIAAMEGKPAEQIARLFGAAEALGGVVATFRWLANRGAYDRALNVIRTQLSESRMSALWEEGRAMKVEQAIESALPDAS